MYNSKPSSESSKFQYHAPGRHASQDGGFGHCAPSFFPLGFTTALFRLLFSLSVLPCFHQNIVPKISTMKLIHAIPIHWPHEMSMFLFPCSHSSQTSRNRFCSSVITPSSSCLILHFIMSCSFTVHTYNGLPFAFASRMKRAPKKGNMSDFCSMLKDTLGTERNLRAYGMEKPICVMGKVGRYSAQRGRNLTDQQPRTKR